MKREKILVPGIISMMAIAFLAAGCSDGARDPVDWIPEAEDITVISLADAGPGKTVVDELASGGAQVIDGRLTLPAAERGSLVVMDSVWFLANKADADVIDFIEDAVNAGAGVVVSGDDTSQLYDLLKSLDLNEFAPGRNPMYSDPPMAGFWIETHGSGQVTRHQFGSNTDDLQLQAVNVAKWIKGETDI